ncbi:hypothetical protein AAMO2058_001452900 [Amorphochlora amoebiformis]
MAKSATFLLIVASFVPHRLASLGGRLDPFPERKGFPYRGNEGVNQACKRRWIQRGVRNLAGGGKEDISDEDKVSFREGLATKEGDVSGKTSNTTQGKRYEVVMPKYLKKGEWHYLIDFHVRPLGIMFSQWAYRAAVQSAKSVPVLQFGDVVKSVNGIKCEKWGFDNVTSLIESSGLPVRILFRRPETKITRLINQFEAVSRVKSQEANEEISRLKEELSKINKTIFGKPHREKGEKPWRRPYLREQTMMEEREALGGDETDERKRGEGGGGRDRGRDNRDRGGGTDIGIGKMGMSSFPNMTEEVASGDGRGGTTTLAIATTINTPARLRDSRVAL